MSPVDPLTIQQAAALIGQQRRLRWPRRRGPSTLWITVTIEDVVQSYGSRWDATVGARPRFESGRGYPPDHDYGHMER